MGYYHNNMRIMESKYRKLYDLIREYEASDKVLIKREYIGQEIIAKVIDKENNLNIYIEPTRTTGYTMRVETRERDIYFHSKYNPEREAERIAKTIGFSEKKQLFILGTGLGYYLKQFNSNYKFDRIVIIEPFLSIFYAALNFNDLSSFLVNDNLVFVIGGETSLFEVIQRNITISLEKELDFLEHSPSLKLFNNKFKEIYKNIKEAINYKKFGLVTDLKIARKWRNNIILNLPSIIESPKADDFFGLFEGLPAICVSAGPSLDKNVTLLKKAKGKVLLMCVGTALKALLKHNIKPDIVVSMDGKRANYRHYKGITLTADSFLLTELGNYHEINQNWVGKQIFFTMKRNFSGWVENLKGDYTSINTGGTVAHSMVDLAYRFGADPIVLVGQDLAFAEGRTHASGTTYGGRETKNEGAIEVEGVNGTPVLTNKGYLSMLTYFNNYFSKRPGRTYIDATEGGARIKHTHVMKLEDVINNYCQTKINIQEILEERYNEVKSDFTKIELELKDEIFSTIEELKKAIKLTREQLTAIVDVEHQLSGFRHFSGEELLNLEKSVSVFEGRLRSLKNISFFVERILIAEAMKLNESKSKYYLTQSQSLKERMKYYRAFRLKFLAELEDSLGLLKNTYVNDNGEIEIMPGRD